METSIYLSREINVIVENEDGVVTSEVILKFTWQIEDAIFYICIHSSKLNCMIGQTRINFQRSRAIVPGEALKDPKVIKALTSDGSKIEDWAKMSIQTYKSPEGEFQVHFY